MVDPVDPCHLGAEEGWFMATAIDRRQVERWLSDGVSLHAIARRLSIPWTTFWRRWQRLQQEAAPPVHAEVTELPPRPGPPTRPPQGPPESPPGSPPTGPPAPIQAGLAPGEQSHACIGIPMTGKQYCLRCRCTHFGLAQ
jgi:hypothetical protein